MLKKMLIKRLKEPSTWAGIIAIVAYFGINIPEELKPYLQDIGVAVGGLVLILMKEGSDEVAAPAADKPEEAPAVATGEGSNPAGQPDTQPDLNNEGQL